MKNNLNQIQYNPDVLSCIANLSNDEVFTPPEVANKMLDMLPQELFESSDTRFLDPCCKSGVFLREIAKRLIKGLESEIPDLERRLEHIFSKQLFGIAITELTSLLSRRSVYCSKFPNSEFSAYQFPDEQPQGNIIFQRIKHTWKDGKCVYCGAAQSEYDRGDELEFIGNPPYQLSDGGAQASAKPLYHLFVEQAKKLNPRYLIMIIPARWYSGGKGLDEFRSNMLNDKNIKELHDFPNTEDCFPGLNIRGGICIFLREKGYNNIINNVKVTTHLGKDICESIRPIKYRNLDLFIRDVRALSILDKVFIRTTSKLSLMNFISARKPFGLATDFFKTAEFKETAEELENPLLCYAKGKKIGYVDKKQIRIHNDWIGKYKVMSPYANNIGTELNDDNLNAYVLAPNCVCTETYIIIGADLNLDKSSATNLVKYLQTRFVRFLHSLAKSSQHATAKTYCFVPVQDFSKHWTDEELYAKYNLTKEEIAFIESMIRPME